MSTQTTRQTFTYSHRGNKYSFDAYIASGWESWNMSIFGAPKISFRCGCCSRVNKKRPGVDPKSAFAHARCDSCGERNVFRTGTSNGNPRLLTLSY